MAALLARRRRGLDLPVRLGLAHVAGSGGEAAAVCDGQRQQQQRAAASTSTSTSTSTVPPGVAFAFDIDGVLLKGSTPIPGAAAALRRLLDPVTGAPAAPFCFITNGGGVPEADKAADVARLLDLPPTAIPPESMILAHTPFAGLATDRPVLVIGGKQSLEVARKYGFTAAASPAQVAAAAPPSQLPLRPRHAVTAVGPLPACPTTGAPAGSPAYPFTAVLVMYDPECWHTDVQITLDVLAGRGVAGGYRAGSAPPASRPPALPIHFSNGDVLWANDHPAPRLGQGAFAAALRAVAAAAGQEHTLTAQVIYGKPTAWPYRLAEQCLVGQAARLASTPGGAVWRATGIRAVVAVGDNPAADMAGAAAAGEPWHGVLVRTGVHSARGNCPVHPATVVVEDVGAAVEWGCRLGRDRAAEWGV